jgi:uncharacterized protein GlcG (DUF336 family)
MANPVLTFALAARAVQLAAAFAEEQRLRVAVAVVDKGGHLVAGARMDGVGYINMEVARRKAVAAVTFGAPTHDVLDYTGNDPYLPGAFQAMSAELIVLPGGFPLTQVVDVLGGLGIAGGHYSQDRMLGERVIAALAEQAAQPGARP